jgi:two-component system C4-dicarboxylate transport response regulator DctD
MRLAEVETDILIIGETGTGKEVAARAVHDFSARGKSRFVAVNCGAIPESMLESELFGHEPGSFTGAKERRIGKIEHANGGTLFLDEIESMPLSAQVRLLRVLQERTLERLGSNKEVALDIRVVSAAKQDLGDLARRGLFREDLVYRLDVARVELPPLRERKSDISLLFIYFLGHAERRLGRTGLQASPAELRQLEARPWPGNVRQLRNAAERYALGIYDSPQIADAHAARPAVDTLEWQINLHERAIILERLSRNDGKIGATAETLGISRKTLYLKMKKLGISNMDLTEVQ